MSRFYDSGSIYRTNVALYTAAYPTTEERREHALTIADIPRDEVVDDNHPSRNILLAQWGDTHKQIQATAFCIYALKNSLKPYMGQTVMVLHQDADKTGNISGRPL